MITKIRLNNLRGIKDTMNLDFIASKTDKKNKNSVFITDDNVWINRIVGIIAGNAHGKTTILDAIASVGSFIELPLTKKNMPTFGGIEMNEYKDEYKEKIFQKMISEFTNLELLGSNKLSEDKPSNIEIEMYIKTESYETTGYYNYFLEYDKNYKADGIKKESLSFKSKYNKKYNTIFQISNSFESEIGYKIAYEKNIINELSSNDISINEFQKKLKYYKAFIKHYNKDSNIICADNYIFPEFYVINMLQECKNTEKLLNFVKLADDNIRDIVIAEDFEKKERLIFKYDDFDLSYNSISTATKKLVAMAYSILESNEKNSIFLIDEFDNSLNLEISKFLIDIFSMQDNSMSQIIFTTNNPEILDSLRRDQIYLLLKNKYKIQAINFYNFIDPVTKKRVRKDYSFIKAYKKNIIENFPNETLKKYILSEFVKDKI